MGRWAAPLLLLSHGLGGWLSQPGLAGGQALPADACAEVRGGEALTLSPVLLPAAPLPADPGNDYRHHLQTTPLGWPLQATWCVWVEPADPSEPAQGPSQRWLVAVSRALEEWQHVLPVVLVNDPQRAQVRLWRRRPPLGMGADGRARASHGRAILSLYSLGRGSVGAVEPRVEVLISAGQRLEAIQATVLHELGHAFGLWGHSDQPGDAMARTPGSQPILKLSQRDRATLQWLYLQPTPMRSHP